MMPRHTLTDYLTLLDGTREHAVRLSFILPDDFVPGTAKAKPVLIFRVDATATKTLWIHVNERSINPTASNGEVTLKVTNEGHRTVHELINGDRFEAGRENVISIASTPDSVSGDLYISDVVLMYQRYIDV